MKSPKIKLFLIASGVIVLLSAGILAQTPSPSVNPMQQIDGATLSAFLEKVVQNFVLFKTTFINTVETTLGGYFSVLAYICAWIIAIFYFSQQALRGEWDMAEIGRYTLALVVCLLLLLFCGDLDQDGRRGDIVRTPAYLGYHLAFGESPDEPTGNYINRLVKTERDKFNTNYQQFIENKLMVKINDKDMPVRYPGMQGIQTVAAVSIGQASEAQQKEWMSQEFMIGLLFQLMNFFRSGIEIIDFFLLVVYAFAILVCSIISPFMCCVFVNRNLRQKLTIPFFWTVFTATIIFPVLSQAARYFAYLAANMALGTNGNPIYTYDPTTFTIVANGDPTPMVLVAVVVMLFSCVLLVMSFMLSYSLAQGKLVESMSGLIANTFAGLSSIGLGAAISSYSTKMAAEGEKSVINAAEQATLGRAGYQQQNQILSAVNAKNVNDQMAQSGYVSTMMNAQGQRESSQLGAVGNYMSGMASTEAQRVGTVNGAVSNFRHALAGMNTEEKQALANNLADMYDKNNTAASRKMAEELRMQPEKLDLIAEDWNNSLSTLPIIGTAITSVAGKDTVNALTRTKEMETFGKFLFGDPYSGNLNNMTEYATGNKNNIAGNAMQANDIYGNGAQPIFERSDGKMINALTGQEITSFANQPNGVSPILGGNVPKLDAQRFMQSLSPNERKTAQVNQRALQNTMRSDPNFLPAIQSFAAQKKLDPNDVLNLLAIESGFNKTASNSHGYIGLGQVGRSERQSIGWSGNDATDLARLSSMSPTQQLDSLVFPFMEKKLGNKLQGANLSTMHAAWGSGHATGNPNAVHMEKGGKRSEAYTNNPSWDFNKDGRVQEWEFGVSPLKKLGAGIVFDAGSKRGQLRTPPKYSSYQTNTGQITTIGSQSSQTASSVGTSINTSASQYYGSSPQFFNRDAGLITINNARSAPNQKFVARKIANESEFINSVAGNRSNMDMKNSIAQQGFAEKRVNEQNFTQEQISNANVQAGIQRTGILANYQTQMQSSETMFSYQSQAANVNRSASLETGKMNFETAVKTANISYAGEAAAAKITKDASLDQLYKRNMSNLVQSVGNTTAHQLSELFERSSKGL